MEQMDEGSMELGFWDSVEEEDAALTRVKAEDPVEW
jgi:hypothetical protein